MASDLDFYVARASQARDEAKDATLDNVRERCLRAAAAWEAMADRARKTARMRHDREAAALARE